MRLACLLLLGSAAVALTACATQDHNIGEDPHPSAATSTVGPDRVTADLRDADGRTRARASVEQAGDSLRVRVEAVSMSPGAYGAHLHAIGRCDPPGFATAGGHWNPTGQMHGKDNPKGMHKGDLPNLLVGTDGRGSFEYTIPGARLSGMDGLMDGDGAAVVIHAAADDYRTDPSGNSGARIACGVVG
jgi:Cu-Zn family superoxide dismutase